MLCDAQENSAKRKAMVILNSLKPKAMKTDEAILSPTPVDS